MNSNPDARSSPSWSNFPNPACQASRMPSPEYRLAAAEQGSGQLDLRRRQPPLHHSLSEFCHHRLLFTFSHYVGGNQHQRACRNLYRHRWLIDYSWLIPYCHLRFPPSRMHVLQQTIARRRGRTECLSCLQCLFLMPRHGNGPEKLQSSPCQVVVGTLTVRNVSGPCYESICPSSKTRNNIVKR